MLLASGTALGTAPVPLNPPSLRAIRQPPTAADTPQAAVRGGAVEMSTRTPRGRRGIRNGVLLVMVHWCSDIAHVFCPSLCTRCSAQALSHRVPGVADAGSFFFCFLVLRTALMQRNDQVLFRPHPNTRPGSR